MPDNHDQEAAAIETDVVACITALSDHQTARVRAVRREFSKRISKSSPAMVVALARKLVDRTELFPFIGYELLLHHKAALSSIDSRQLQRLGRGIDSWVAVDTFASYVSGPVWRERQVPDTLIHDWANSPDRWWRRAALVSTVPLNNKTRGGGGDAVRTLRVCELLVEDRDDMVVKAMSWALRELAKRDREAVREFLAEHQEALAPRVLREVNNKILTGLKNPR